MSPTDIGFSPTLTFLSDDDKGKLHEAILTLLETTGMTLLHDGAMEKMKSAGCGFTEDGRVTVPRKLVEKALASAPNSVKIYNRDGEPAMDLGGRRSYYGTGSDLMSHVSAATGARHRTGLEDIARSARLCDALPNIDFIMSYAHPHELDPHQAYLESFRAMVENSRKPIVNTAECRNDLAEMWEISKIIRGGEAELRAKPYWVQYDEPISPLKHPFTSVDKLVFCAETGMPVIYSPAPIAGSTAPMTPAGHVVQGLAESLFGLVIHQLTAEGAPFLVGIGPAVLDMATGQCSYNAPEYLLSLMAMVEMAKYFDLPNWGYAGTSDSQIPDMQTAFEGGLLTFMSALSGSNLNHDVGYLDFGLAGCLEWVVVMDEIIDQVRRIQKGIPVNEESIALEVIAEAGQAGQFLTHPHTLKHLRSVQWRPKLMNRMGHEKWEKSGSPTVLDKAIRRTEDILSTHEAPALPEETVRAIAGRVEGFAAAQ
ncbi:MAG: trimethylamine methyltransferase family protein [Desulfococcaceae bacterium]